jgi:hypothetical protein
VNKELNKELNPKSTSNKKQSKIPKKKISPNSNQTSQKERFPKPPSNWRSHLPQKSTPAPKHVKSNTSNQKKEKTSNSIENTHKKYIKNTKYETPVDYNSSESERGKLYH